MFKAVALVLLPLVAAVPATPAGTCSQDNLARCYSHSLAAASGYCSGLASTVTVTASTSTVTTTTTPVATKLRRANSTPPSCVTKSSYSPARISSACACIGVSPTTTTVTTTPMTTVTATATCTPIMPVHGFGPGLPGWTVDAVPKNGKVQGTNGGFLQMWTDSVGTKGVISQALNTIAGSSYTFKAFYRNIAGSCVWQLSLNSGANTMTLPGTGNGMGTPGPVVNSTYSFVSEAGNDILHVAMLCSIDAGNMEFSGFDIIDVSPAPVGCRQGPKNFL